jgi:hypothetical protein
MGIENAPITCYEAVMPNPIPNYAYNALAEACDVTEMTDSEKEQLRSTLFFGDTEVLENTNRFSIPSLYKYVKSKKYMTMRTDSISYPYWENIARFEVERASRLFIFCCILLLLPAATVIGTIIWLYTKRGVVFNSRNKERVMDFLGEFAEGVKNRLKHPEKENYDDDEEPEEPAEEEVPEDSGEDNESAPESFQEEEYEPEEPAEEEEQEVQTEEPAEEVEPAVEEPVEEAAGPKMSALSRLESIREEDDSDESANHQLNINADDDLGIELEVVEN